MTRVIQVSTEEQIEETRAIFREYERWLGVSLCFQGFDSELAGLPGEYVPPSGSLLLAIEDGKVAGCVAFRPLSNRICEIKRLFVRDQYRGSGIGRMLLLNLIERAKLGGYEKMRLDSWPPKMEKAIAMYASHGFVEIERYNDNPYDMVFMELDLTLK